MVAGCSFRVAATQAAGGGDDFAVAEVDLGGVAGEVDLAMATTSGDLAPSPPDLTIDPCGTAPLLGAANVAAQCVIGNPPVVDGDLADWPTSLFQGMTRSTSGVTTTTPSAWTGTPATDDADCSARWAVRWD